MIDGMLKNKIAEFSSKITFNRYTVLLIFGVLGNALLWWFWSRFPEGGTPLVLRYQLGGGIDVLGERPLLATIPLLGLLVLLINGGLVTVLYRRDVALATLTAMVAVAFQALLLFAMLALVAKNLI